MLIKRKWLAASLVAALGAAGATVVQFNGASPLVAALDAAGAMVAQFNNSSIPATFGSSDTGSAGAVPPSSPDDSTLETLTEVYIVVLDEAPLASYRGELRGLPAPKSLQGARNSARIDVHSDEAKQYVSYLQREQSMDIAELSQEIGRPLRVQRRMQHAINAIVTELTEAEAALLAQQPGVSLVEAYQEFRIETDIGPALIGAEPVWTGATPGEPGRFQGEGMVVGIIDTGINFGSPSFAAVDPVDGYRHVNKLGAGNYLGTCRPGQVDEGRCNDKLIGGYDFVCNLSMGAGTYCNQPSLYREEPGFGDTNNHGTHVASTAAGNRRDVVFKGTPLRISGVAPRANIVAYDTCYTQLSDNGGLCPSDATLAAVDQAVADGVVDVINFSIGGGNSPWSDALSLAFLNAAGAGIYVAAAAGNSGPGPGTTGHQQPWVGTTAAVQHGRGDFVYRLTVTSPTPVPAGLQGIELSEGSGGVALAATLPAGTPLRVSSRIDTADDGCAAFSAGAFTNSIALVRRGTCGFAVKVQNAANAGAIAVVIANNQAGALNPTVTGATVPAFLVTQTAGNQLRDFAAANGGSITATIPLGAQPLSNTPDQLADFSSRGPAGNGLVLKPDVAAPGVRVLAAIAGTTLTGSENAIGLINGTSMASPHHAGAAALIRQARPSWTTPEIKSALMMTAKPEVLMEDGVTPANPLARGSGRISVDQAIRAGLVLNETKARYLAANPATGGDPSALNMPNMVNGNCVERCVFTRTFRNTLPHRQSWAATVQGIGATVSPAVFSVNPGASVTVTVRVSAASVPANNTFNFGTLVLQPHAAGNPNQPVLRLPMAIAVRPPVASLPAQMNATVAAGGTTSVLIPVGNAGGLRLSFNLSNTGTSPYSLASTLPTAAGSGFRSSRYTDAVLPPGVPPGQYAADDFQLLDTTRLSTLVANGFLLSTTPLALATQNITWSIYPDVGGVPAGNPETNPGAAVWSYTALPTAPGVGTANATISLNLATAGQNVILPPGRYWLVVNGRTTFANRWVWYASDTRAPSSGNGLMAISPASGGWTANTSFPGLSWLVDASVACGAGWIGAATPSAGQVAPAGSSNVMLTINAAGLSAGSYSGYACFATNDPARPRAAVRVTLTVTP